MLAGERSYLIGLFYDKPGAYLTDFLPPAAADRCRESGYHLDEWKSCDPRQPAVHQAGLSTLLRQMRLDGVILLPPLSDDGLIGKYLCAMLRSPALRIAPSRSTTPRTSPSIGIDDLPLAARRLTAHLVGLGHRRIGFILGKPGHGATEERYSAVSPTKCGLITCPSDVSLVATGNFRVSGRRGLRGAIASRSRTPPNRDLRQQ